MSHAAGNYFATGTPPGRIGNRHPSICPYREFACSDGEIIVAAANDSLWERFARAIGRVDLAGDPRWKRNADRVAGRDALEAELGKTLSARTRAEWLRAISEGGVPCGPVRDIGELANNPQIAHRDMVVEMAHPTVGTLKVMGVPVKLSATPGAAAAPPPLLGEHTGEVLADLGYSPEEIDLLRTQGVV